MWQEGDCRTIVINPSDYIKQLYLPCQFFQYPYDLFLWKFHCFPKKQFRDGFKLSLFVNQKETLYYVNVRGLQKLTQHKKTEWCLNIL